MATATAMGHLKTPMKRSASHQRFVIIPMCSLVKQKDNVKSLILIAKQATSANATALQMVSTIVLVALIQ